MGLPTRCPGPVDGTTVFGREAIVDNPHDYVLKDGALVYDPPKEVKA